MKKQCLLWALVSDFNSVKVSFFPYIVLSFANILSDLIYFILSLTYQCLMALPRKLCANCQHTYCTHSSGMDSVIIELM